MTNTLLRPMRLMSGGLLLLIGAALMVLPGPGILFLLMGLSVLAKDSNWAKTKLDRLKEYAAQAKKRALERPAI
jgi:Putative transmembrane protein (PGPGW)